MTDTDIDKILAKAMADANRKTEQLERQLAKDKKTFRRGLPWAIGAAILGLLLI